jgi:hypothetical protein
VPTDDVDPFRIQLIDDLLEAVPAQTNAHTDAIDLWIVAAHGDLAAISKSSSDSPDLDDAGRDFGNLLCKEASDYF